ncbi:unnamed protein product [Orchesella dallaii]|uniref:Uncharacterized protein n=1 Tax=Orchesella dallaii TaxID=48710 RepID=A0ABP1S107_9HEXA
MSDFNALQAHSPGLVPIRVYTNGKQISTNSMVFEYKADARLNMVSVPPTDTSLKLCLIHRMECLEKCFRNFKGDFVGIKSLEDGAVRICMGLMGQDWVSDDDDLSKILPPLDRRMTLLHISAALGYARLVFTLIRWKRENPSRILDSEVNPHQPDGLGLIPLMWCARYGHLECGIILAQWSPECLQKRDSGGLNPVQIAVASGFVKCASELEKIQASRANPTFGQSLDCTSGMTILKSAYSIYLPNSL